MFKHKKGNGIGNGYKTKNSHSDKTCRKCGSVEIKTTSVCIAGPKTGTETIPMTKTGMSRPIEAELPRGDTRADAGDAHQKTQRADPEAELAPEIPTA